MTIILHIGCDKAGSTSIQNYLFKLNEVGKISKYQNELLCKRTKHHSHLLNLLPITFTNNVVGLKSKKCDCERERHSNRIMDGEIISSEALCHPDITCEAIKDLKDFCDTDNIILVLVVRDFQSWIRSKWLHRVYNNHCVDTLEVFCEEVIKFGVHKIYDRISLIGEIFNIKRFVLIDLDKVDLLKTFTAELSIPYDESLIDILNKTTLRVPVKSKVFCNRIFGRFSNFKYFEILSDILFRKFFPDTFLADCEELSFALKAQLVLEEEKVKCR